MARQSQSDALGIPPGLQIYSSFPFAGLNLSSSRPAIRDQEFYNIENFVRIGDGFLRTLWDNGDALYTVSGSQTIINAFFYNIATTQYAVVFLSDGTAYQVQVSNGSVTTISSVVGTFYVSGGSLPGCIQWGSQYLIIGNNNTQNDYWIWDGSLLYTAGTLSPVVTVTDGGSGYTSSPTITAYGGVGTGATFTSTIQNGSVVSITETNPGSGYGVNDQVQLLITGGGSDNAAQLTAVLSNNTISSIVVTAGGTGYTSAPTVTISGGGGSGATATASVTSNAVTSVTVTNGGSGYTSTPTVSFGGPGTGALASAFIAPGYITAINVTSGGSGYTAAPTLTIVGGGGTGATATAILTPTSIATITPTAGGSGYTSTPSVTIGTPNMAGGVQATATAIVTNEQVTGFTVTNAGSGYTSAPTVSLSGGGGSNAAAMASLTPTSIGSVTVNNPGSGYTSVPAVEIESGLNRGATATVQLMPYGISGTTLESFQSRMWIANAFTPASNPPSKNNGNRMFVSAPGSLSDFSTSDGGLIFTATDRFLRQKFVALQQSNGYLYPIGDSSVSIISGVTTSGSPPTTTFNYQNTDPQVGTSFRDSCQDFGRTILFANPLGVYGLYGGSVTKVSQQLDPLFSFASFPPSAGALTPTSAVANIFGGKYFLLLMTLLDPITFTYQNKMILWDEESWFIASQTANLKFILTQEVNSDLTAWGSDGKSLYPLFQTPNTALEKTISTKLFGGNNPIVAKEAYTVMLQSVNTGSFGSPVTFTIDLDTDGGQYPIGTYTFSLSSGYEFGYPFFVTGLTNAVGIYLGVSLSTNDADITITYLGITYIPATFQIGSIGLIVPGQT
ncbi:MAG TPA: hypothetical protein VMP68_07750 [Candidatus Eisenbacteria bacterium]|nr:hypothetical protein [Candidatus Eisenbacteria bacterium]